MKWIAAVVLLLLLPGCGDPASQAPARPRAVILGFDGVEPDIVDAMLAAGRLPHLAQLRAGGSYHRLQTTVPPQSPSAWSSFATCQQPGHHGIYDYIGRDPQTYAPMMGVGMTLPYEFFPDGEVRRKPESVSFRNGEPFWRAADRQGARARLLQIPFAFPPDDLAHGTMLCGAGIPEIGGYNTYFYDFSDHFTAAERAESVSGGVRIPIAFTGDTATVAVPGALDPMQPGSAARVPVSLDIAVDRSARSVTFAFQGQQVTVSEGAWSAWLEWTLPVTDELSVRAISQFYVRSAGAQVRFYMSSLQFHPRAPYVPFTTPETYSGALADRYGLYKTLGWTHDTNALRRDALEEEAFLQEAAAHDAWLHRLLLDEMEEEAFELLVAVWTSTDRIAHTFWRFRDPAHPLYTAEGAAAYGDVVEKSYERMDRIVGDVVARLDPGDLLLVLSDHGFHSFRTGFSVNTWLVRQGYLVLQGQTDAATAHIPDESDMLRSVDWSRSRAYGLGLGAIYLNLRGREGQGIVTPDEAPALAAEIRARLLAVTDPDSGHPVFTTVFGREAFDGPRQAGAPDLQLGYADGYQTSKVSAKGGVPVQVFEPNLDKWSGEHASSDPAATPGILFSNRPLTGSPAIIDVGVTVLRHLGLEVPAEYQGSDRQAADGG